MGDRSGKPATRQPRTPNAFGGTAFGVDSQRLSWQHEVLRCFRWNGFAPRKGERPFKPDGRSDRWSKIARKVILIDRGPENRQHGYKPYFTRVSLLFSAGNTAATGGNMLLLFVIG